MITQEFLFTMSKYISGIANRNNVDDWSARASANSFKRSDTNRSGGAPNEQRTSNDWYTARDRSGDCGVALGYEGAVEDRGFKGDNQAGNHKFPHGLDDGSGSGQGREALAAVQR